MATKKQYIGKYEVESSKDLENGLVEVAFRPYETGEVDGEKLYFYPPTEKLAKVLYDELLSKEPTDHATYVSRRVELIAKAVLKVLIEYNVYIGAEQGDRSELTKVYEHIMREHLLPTRDQVDDYLWGSAEHKKTISELFDHMMDFQTEFDEVKGTSKE